MKKIFSLLAVAAFAITSFGQSSLEIGKEIPGGDVMMKTVDNKEISLNDAKSQNGLLVMFSCNTCPVVIKSEARTKEINEYAKKNDIGVIIINSNEALRDEADSYEAMKKYSKKQNYIVPYVVDENSKLAGLFGATRTPEVFLFDSNGTLIYKGAMEDNPSNPSESKQMFLKNAIDNILAGDLPDPSTTRSIGCSIKRKS